MVRSGVSTRKRRTRKRRTRVRSQRVKCRTRRKTRPRRTVRKKRKSLRGGTSFGTGVPFTHTATTRHLDKELPIPRHLDKELPIPRPEIQVYFTPYFEERIRTNPSADSLLVFERDMPQYLEHTLEQIQGCYDEGIRLLIVTAHQHSILDLCQRLHLNPASAVAGAAVAAPESVASEWEFDGIQQFTQVRDKIKLNNLKYVIMRRKRDGVYLMLIRHCEGTHQKPGLAAVTDYHGINQTCMNQYAVDQNSYLGIADKIAGLARNVNNAESLSGKKYSVIDMVERSGKPSLLPLFAVQSTSHNMGVTVKGNLGLLPKLEKSDDDTPLMCNQEKMTGAALLTSKPTLNPRDTQVIISTGVASPASTPVPEPQNTSKVKFVSSPIFRAMMTMENTLRALREREGQVSVGAA